MCFSIPNYRTTFSTTFSTIFTLLFPPQLVDLLGKVPTNICLKGQPHQTEQDSSWFYYYYFFLNHIYFNSGVYTVHRTLFPPSILLYSYFNCNTSPEIDFLPFKQMMVQKRIKKNNFLLLMSALFCRVTWWETRGEGIK